MTYRCFSAHFSGIFGIFGLFEWFYYDVTEHGSWSRNKSRLNKSPFPLYSRPHCQSFSGPQPKCISGTRHLLKAAVYILSFRKSLQVTATSQWLQDKRHTPSDTETSRGSCCTAMTKKNINTSIIFGLRSRTGSLCLLTKWKSRTGSVWEIKACF